MSGVCVVFSRAADDAFEVHPERVGAGVLREALLGLAELRPSRRAAPNRRLRQ
jgi:hypothetical protein